MVPDLHWVLALHPSCTRCHPSAPCPWWPRGSSEGCGPKHNTFQENVGSLCLCQKPACCPVRAERARERVRVLLRGRGTAAGADACCHTECRRLGSSAEGSPLRSAVRLQGPGAQESGGQPSQSPELVLGPVAPGHCPLYVSPAVCTLLPLPTPGALPLPLLPQACSPSASSGFPWAIRGPVSRACQG